jgi:hypothetical protein
MACHYEPLASDEQFLSNCQSLVIEFVVIFENKKTFSSFQVSDSRDAKSIIPPFIKYSFRLIYYFGYLYDVCLTLCQ